jgi:GlpG protein
MRQAGTLSNRDHAERLVDFLLTQGISGKVDAEADRWAIWIHNEDQLAKAKSLLQEFQANPEAEKYRGAEETADSLRRQTALENEKRRKNVIEMRDKWSTLHPTPRPVTMALIAISVFISLATNFGTEDNDLLQSVMFQSLRADQFGRLEANSWTQDIDQGQLWRLVTPMFLHFGVLHIVFNMYWLYVLGSAIESRRGSLRFGVLVLVLAVLSNYAQYFFSFEMGWEKQPTIRFGGMSGVNYGLFGYVWMKSKFDPLSGLRMASQTVFVMVLWFFLCWAGVVGSIANWAHTFGLIAGMAIGYAPIAWRKSQRR